MNIKEQQKMDASELKHQPKRMNKNGTFRSSLLGTKISSQKSGAKKLMEVENFLKNSSRKFQVENWLRKRLHG